MARSSISINVPYIKTLHKQPYPAISPSRPELSQAGRTVLIIGGSAGIGFAIARAFIRASASHVIITGRRDGALADAVSRLEQTEGGAAGARISSYVSDMASLQDTEKLWEGFKGAGVAIDVLVMNGFTSGAVSPLLDADLGSTWKAFETNVRGLLDHAQRFHRQEGSRRKHLVNVSTTAIHVFDTEGDKVPTYSLTKNSGTLLMQLIAKDTDPKDLQIINFHPGGVLSESARSVGYSEDSLDWDHEDLPGQFAVWCASDEAQFLHGRFVPAWWDVDELKADEFRRRVESEYHFLKVGVVGL